MGIPVDVARQIDIKMDDGAPNTGKVGVIAGSVSCGGTNYTAYPARSSPCMVTLRNVL